jgi:hypothetical protein
MKPLDLIFSWDTGAAVILAGLLWWLLPNPMPGEFCKDIYAVGISVLSILFSLWAAALALLMTSPDDEFVRFMEQEGDYTFLVGTFKVTLVSLFVALAASIGLYAGTAFALGTVRTQNKAWMVGFAFMATYALVAALLSMLDSIRYAERRVKFLKPPEDSGPGEIR